MYTQFSVKFLSILLLYSRVLFYATKKKFLFHIIHDDDVKAIYVSDVEEYTKQSKKNVSLSL